MDAAFPSPFHSLLHRTAIRSVPPNDTPSPVEQRTKIGLLETWAWKATRNSTVEPDIDDAAATEVATIIVEPAANVVTTTARQSSSMTVADISRAAVAITAMRTVQAATMERAIVAAAAEVLRAVTAAIKTAAKPS